VPYTLQDSFSSIAAGYNYTCGKRKHGGVVCWGSNANNGTAVPIGTCGDGIVAPGEACDDKNTVSGDGCDSNCTSDESCGNGIVDSANPRQIPEACDDGGDVQGDTCASDCSKPWSALNIPAPSLAFSFDAATKYQTTYANLGTGPVVSGTILGPGLTTSSSGIAGEAVVTPGTITDYISAGDLPDKGTSVTVAAWVSPYTGSVAPVCSVAEYSATLGGTLGWALTTAPGDPSNAWFSAGNASLPATPSTQAASEGLNWNQWNHLAASYDETSGALTMYVNGVQSASASAVGFSQLGYLASEFKVGYGLRAAVDELAVWNSALTPSNITDLYSMGIYRRPIARQMPVNVYMSPCARELARNPSATNGVYSFAIGKSSEAALPVYCDMSNGGWTMLMKKSSGVAYYARNLWMDAPVNEGIATTLADGRKKSTVDYASRLAQIWPMFREARLEVITGGATPTVTRSIAFNLEGSTRWDWFNPRRVTASSWTDLPTAANWEGSGDGRYFSIPDYSLTRQFFINNNYGASCTDVGWLMVSAGSTACTYDSPNYTVRYSTLTTKQACSSYGTADALIIFAR
jgi:cysteine-rich repeat protein